MRSKKSFPFVGAATLLGFYILQPAKAENLSNLSPEAVQGVKEYVGFYVGNGLAASAGQGGWSLANIIAWVIFGGVGFIAFVYGKKMSSWRPMVIGIALMAYPYFVTNTVALYLVGIVLCAGLYFFRE